MRPDKNAAVAMCSGKGLNTKEKSDESNYAGYKGD